MSLKILNRVVLVHHYENRYAEAFAITKLWMFKHEPFFGFGGGGGGGGGGLCYITCIVIRAVSQAKGYMITHESSYTVHAIRKSEILVSGLFSKFGLYTNFSRRHAERWSPMVAAVGPR